MRYESEQQMRRANSSFKREAFWTLILNLATVIISLIAFIAASIFRAVSSPSN